MVATAREISHVTERASGGGRVVRLRVVGGTVDLREGVPTSRASCPPRPCGYVRCKWHLWLMLGEDQPGRRAPGRKLPQTTLRAEVMTMWPLPPTCALDIAERVAEEKSYTTVEEIADAYGMRQSFFREVVARAIATLAAGGADPEELIEALSSARAP